MPDKQRSLTGFLLENDGIRRRGVPSVLQVSIGSQDSTAAPVSWQEGPEAPQDSIFVFQAFISPWHLYLVVLSWSRDLSL